MHSRFNGVCERWRWVFLPAFVAAWISSGSAQTGPMLASLTVPDRNLPSGCRLKPFVPATRSTVGNTVTVTPQSAFPFPSNPFPSNPWFGIERRLVVMLRQSIDGAPRFPDAPPPTAAEMATFERQWTANVVEGYRAEYVSAENVVFQVSAIRFDDARLATTTPLADMPRASRGVSDRFVVGAASVHVVQLQASSKTECFQAIGTYVRALK